MKTVFLYQFFFCRYVLTQKELTRIWVPFELLVVSTYVSMFRENKACLFKCSIRDVDLPFQILKLSAPSSYLERNQSVHCKTCAAWEQNKKE